MVENMKSFYQWSVICFLAVCSVFFMTPQASAKEQTAIVIYNDATGLANIQQNHRGIENHYENLKTVEGDFTATQLKQLKKDPHIALVETRDIELNTLSEDLPWNLALLNTTYAWSHDLTAGNVKVGMLDTGVNWQAGLEKVHRITLVDSDAYRDIRNHGTMVANILASTNEYLPGIAPNMDLYSIKIFDDDNEASVSDFLAGIDWAIDNDLDVLNMSLGTKKDYQLLHNAVQAAEKAGITMVAAAGNDYSKKPINYPAAYKEVIAVGAINKEKEHADFSNGGKELEFVAPGEKIPSLTNKLYSGTSFAVPHVTARIATLKQQYPTWSTAKLRSYLRNYTEDLGSAGRDNLYGYGLISYTLQAPQTLSTLKTDYIGKNEVRIQYSMPKNATVPIAKYELYVDGKRVKTTTNTTYRITKLKTNSKHKIEVIPVSTAGKKAKKAKGIVVRTAKKTASKEYLDRHKKSMQSLFSNLAKADMRDDYSKLYSLSDELSQSKRKKMRTAATKKHAVVLSKDKTTASFVKVSNLNKMPAKGYSDIKFSTLLKPVKSSSYRLKRSGATVSGYKVSKVDSKTLRLKLPANAKPGRYAFVLERNNVKTTKNKMIDKHIIVYFEL